MTHDLDRLLDALDAADAAVRDIYRKLADDPDLTVAYEGELRDLHTKRADLARQVGMAALAQRRTSRANTEPVATARTTSSALDHPPPAVVEQATNGVTPSAPTSLEPETLASESAPAAEPLSPAPHRPAEAPTSAPFVPAPPPSGRIPPPPASDAQFAVFRDAVQSKGLGATLKTDPGGSTSRADERAGRHGGYLR